MLKQKLKFKNSTKIAAFLGALSLIIITIPTHGFGVFAATCNSASDCQAQIDRLNVQNSSAQQSLSSLLAQAGSYEDAINRLQAQIDGLQQQINANEQQQAQLQQQIDQDQADLDHQKKVLGEDIKAIYLEGDTTTLEILASSKDLSQFVNKQTYRNAVQNKVKSQVDTITKLEQQVKDQQTQVKQLLQTQQTQRDQITAVQNQQAQLLGYNESQQSSFNQQIKTNNSQIQQLQAQKAAQLRAIEGTAYYGGTGSYPWYNAPCPYGAAGGSTCYNYDWAYSTGPVPLGAPTGPFDPWGYEYRNCTSYVAWKIDSLSSSPAIGSLISQLGNAADWPYNSSVPHTNGHGAQYGDAAVVPGVANGQGHVVFVEHVNDDGTINISQYNAGVPGVYSEAYNVSQSGFIFVHFPGM